MKKTTALSSMKGSAKQLPAAKSIAMLAHLHDEKKQALSFYFSLSSFADSAHREEVLNLDHLVTTARSESESGMNNPDLSNDLNRILSMQEQIRENPIRYRAVFACSHKHIWQEFDLPVSENVSLLQTAGYFRLVPLLRAFESCMPYCAVIVEHGKAKIFIIRGFEVHELEYQPQPVDLSVEADDSRVGWSHHIDANVEERTKAYMKTLTADLHQNMQAEQVKHVVVGCREDLWSELEPQFAKAGMSDMVAGHFHLASFDLTAYSVLQAAQPVLAEHMRQCYAQFWKDIEEKPSHSAVGVENVLRSLESGRVHRLFLGDPAGSNVNQCANCGEWWFMSKDVCAKCGSSDVFSMPTEELLFRKALLTDAEILAPDITTASLFDGVGALLRY